MVDKKNIKTNKISKYVIKGNKMGFYGKRGQVVTYLPFKQYLILIGILVLLIYGYRWYANSSWGTSCPEGIIPERFKGGTENSFKTFEWLDGTVSNNYVYCYKGKYTGENINYTYCQMQYSNTPVINGIIQDKVTYNIKLGINTEDCNEEGCKIASATC